MGPCSLVCRCDPGRVCSPPRGPGVFWGGVISTTGGVRLELGMGGKGSSFYLFGDGGVLTGQHVLDNARAESAVGADFRIGGWPSAGRLTIGGSLFGMHYAHNELGLSYGQGGYFSPEHYLLASVPVTFKGHSGASFHYVVSGSLGVQTFQQDEAPFYPLDPALQSSFLPTNGVPCTGGQAPSYNCGEYPATVNTGLNYAINAEAVYRVAEHCYAGAFLSGNNTNNYNTITGGFFVRYLFRPQTSTEDYPTGLFPVEGFRPLRVP